MNLFDGLLSFHKKHRWWSHVIFWFIFLLISVGSSKFRDGDKGSLRFEFTSDALYMSAEMLFTYAFAYFVVPQFVYHKRYLLSVGVFLLASYTSCAIGRIFIVKICEPLAGQPPKAFETYAEIFADIPKLVYVYFFDMLTAGCIFVIFQILKDKLIFQEHALQLEKEKAETELKLLKTQLNPHFLFNTLNNIYSLSFTSSPATSESIARLADILDHILYRCDTQYIPLSAEITLIKNYIELEKLRYNDRLTVGFETSVDHEIVIAPLILLSLVENAFKHGASDDTGTPVIDIDLKVSEQTFTFNISNTVAEQKTETESPSTDRIGLNNLRQQLNLIYGKDYSLEVMRQGEYFKVCLTIALKHDTTAYEKSQVLAG